MSAAGAAVYGVLLLAHGGDARWNAEIEKVRAQVDAAAPAETALGMADPKAMQAAVDRLAARGAKKVVAVPLYVSSRSEVMQQTRYALGLSERPSEVLRDAAAKMAEAMKDAPSGHAGHGAHGGHGGHGAQGAHGAHAHHVFSLERVKSPVPLALTDALDDDPFVSSVLLERAKALSKDAAKESVILIAHGPNDEDAVKAWNGALSAHARYLEEKGGFARVTSSLLRDDAPALRAKAVEELRARVEAQGKDGRVLIVPVLISRGGIEHKIPRDLKGLDYAWSGETLMPHPGFPDWVLKRAKAAASRP